MDVKNSVISEPEINLEEKNKPSRYISGTKSHIIYLPIIILIFSIYAFYLISVTRSTIELIPIIPGSALTDAIILFILFPLGGYFLILISPSIAMGYYKIYRLIFGKSKLYYLDMRVQLENWNAVDIAKRAVTPGLLICAFSQVIVTSTGVNMWAVGDDSAIVLALFNAAFIAFPIVMFLLVPLWLLYDSGVMSQTNPEKASKKRSPETVETIYQFFIRQFKGFGSIAFIVGIISLIIQSIFLNQTPLMILFTIFVPFLGIALIIPAQIIHEKRLSIMTKKIHELTMLHQSKLSLVTVDKCPACRPKT